MIFFNEVLLRLTGWRSRDILVDRTFLRHIAPEKSRLLERLASIPDPEGVPRHFRIASFPVETLSGTYTLVRVRPQSPASYSGAAGPADQYETMFHHIGDGLFTANLKGRVLSANPAFFKLLECPEGGAVDNIGEHYVYQEELEDKLLRLLEEEAIYNVESHLYTRSRAIKRVLDSSWVIRDDQGVVAGYASQLKDVTYLKNLEARLRISERNYSLLFDTLLSSIIILDPLGRIVNWNYQAGQLYGYSREEVAGLPFDEVFPPDGGRLSIEEILRRVDQHERYIETEVPRLRKDGKILYTYASYTAMWNTSGELVAYRITEKDLTERIELERKLKDSLDQLKETQEATILGFAKLTEYRDKSTGKHLQSIKQYTKVLAEGLRGRKDYGEYIKPGYLEDLCLSAILHDVGKVAIPDSILLKPGKLTPEEYERIKEHARMGGDALEEVDQEIERESFLTLGKEIAHYHHERWDGTGYPKGLAGESIPLSARIVALADVYDALTSDRPYRPAMTHEQAVTLIAEGRGSQFDPDVADTFLEHQEKFRQIMEEHVLGPAAPPAENIDALRPQGAPEGAAERAPEGSPAPQPSGAAEAPGAPGEP